MVEQWDREQDGGQAGHFAPDTESGPQNPLTRIHGCIHCPHTEPGAEGPCNELDKITVRYFLHTLAEVAVAIASRKADQ